MTAFTLDLTGAIALTDEQFWQLCRNNRDLRFERSRQGELIVMAPTGGETGHRNGRIVQQLFNWSDRDGTGIAFDASTGFKLPNGANRSPDAAWIRLDRWMPLSETQRQRFVPLYPDFAIALKSPSDSLSTLHEKMEAYRGNGVQLGWLVDRGDRSVYIDRWDRELEILQDPDSLSGEPILPGFRLDLARIG